MVIVVELLLLMLLLVSTGRSTSSNANGSLCRCGRSSSCSAIRTGLGDMRMSSFRRRRPDERRFLESKQKKQTGKKEKSNENDETTFWTCLIKTIISQSLKNSPENTSMLNSSITTRPQPIHLLGLQVIWPARRRRGWRVGLRVQSSRLEEEFGDYRVRAATTTTGHREIKLAFYN